MKIRAVPRMDLVEKPRGEIFIPTPDRRGSSLPTFEPPSICKLCLQVSVGYFLKEIITTRNERSLFFNFLGGEKHDLFKLFSIFFLFEESLNLREKKILYYFWGSVEKDHVDQLRETSVNDCLGVEGLNYAVIEYSALCGIFLVKWESREAFPLSFQNFPEGVVARTNYLIRRRISSISFFFCSNFNNYH